MSEHPVVLAIDPGRSKCGVAVVRQDGTSLKRDIVPVEGLQSTVIELITKYAPVAIVCGDGTGAKPILKMLREVVKDAIEKIEKDALEAGSESILPVPSLIPTPVITPVITPILTIDESYSSEQARVRFLRENRPPLLQRLLPPPLRTPWLPYDDYVAQILAERYWLARVVPDDQVVLDPE